MSTDTPIVILTRAFATPHVTMGMLQIAGTDHEPIFTLENPWKDNKPVISSIPPDSYVCTPYSGTKFKDVWMVQGVPSRSAVLIHYGNFETDTDGCILLGMGAGLLKDKPAVTESRKAIDYLHLLLGHKSFILIIK